MKARGEFAEWAQVHDFLYATPREPLDRCIQGGRDILLDIDVQGAEKIKHRYPAAVSIFLLPPSLQELGRRLTSRGTEGKETVRRRLSNARDEIPAILKYDYYVVNRDVREAIGVLESIVEAERARTSRVSGWRFDLLQEERRKRAHEQRN
jgi:guanylate kinase